jgi:hypothetical protein
MLTVSAWLALGWQSSLKRLAACAAMAALGLAPGVVRHAHAQAKPAAHAASCADCHAGVASSYVHAPMRNALETPDDDPVLAAHPHLSVQEGAYTYNVDTKDGKSTYSVTDGKDTLSVPMHWMFGQHSQTWVLEKDGSLYEGLVSYFHRDQSLSTTPGDGKIVPHDLTEAMGRKLNTWEVIQCFNCHATHASDGAALTLDKLTPGLGCARCHVGADQHMQDAIHDNFKSLPSTLHKMNALDTANFCGQCHRTWDTVMRNKWKGQVDVRFQPYRLENSRCFIGTDSRISCLACHNPHQPVNHDDAFYDSKCLACHAAQKPEAVIAGIKTCPVSKEKCVSCHMPKVELPGGHALFTDHMIRITHPGEPYPD